MRAIVLLLCLVLVSCESRTPAFAPLPLEAGPGSAQPHLARSPGGTVVLSWLQPVDNDAVELRYAVLGESAWQLPHTVARGDNWFVNWADFPSVVPMDDSLWAAHWLAKSSGGTYSYDVVIALSTDAGKTWSEPVTPHLDDTRTEHGFVSLFPWQSGVGALWLDGRNMAADGVDEPGAPDSHGADSGHDGGHGHMTLRSAVLSPASQILRSDLVDDVVCDCCQTDVVSGSGGPVAVYRDRTADEIRDIYVAGVQDGQWGPGAAVADDGWEIAGCPVNGPALARQGNDAVVAWFTGAHDQPAVRFARSADNARSFGPAVEIDGAGAIGRVDVVLLDDGDAAVSWLRKDENGDGEIALRFVSPQGRPGPVHVVAKTGVSRSSGFPQLEVDGDSLVLAWTATTADSTQVQSARIR